MDDWYRKTERLLYDHKTVERAIAAKKRELDLILSTMYPSQVAKYDGDPVQSGPGDQTASWAIRRAEGREVMLYRQRIRELEKDRDNIGAALEVLTEEEAHVMQLRYVEEKDMQIVADVMQKTRQTVHTIRQNLVRKVAKCLGYAVESETA